MKVAAIQTPGTALSNWQSTLKLGDKLLVEAVERGAELAVLPECFWPAYRLPDAAAYFAERDRGLPPPQFFLDHLQKFAAERGVGICAGFIDEDDSRLCNAAALISPEGKLLGVHCKCFLWAFDRDYFERGDVIRPLNTPWGSIGLLICADARLPEIPATLAARGARLLLQPTGWVDVPGPEPLWNPQPDFLVPERAAEFDIPIVSASKWGREGDTTFVGRSLICDGTGTIRAQCGPEETGVIVADIVPAEPRAATVTPTERDVLLSDLPPATPVSKVAPLDVLLAPPQMSPEHALQSAEDHAPRGHHALVLSAPRDCTTDVICGDRGLCICRPTGEPRSVGGAQLVGLDADALNRFAPLRCRALRGLHLAVALGAETNLRSVRCRACENRVVVIWAAPEQVTISDTGGRIVATAPWPPRGAPLRSIAALDLSSAALKEVARGTHVLADRTPDQYAL